jgi:ABC-type oligopeptide transport system substrate-binding subunit/class 3 adenylate cyclase
MAQFNGAQSEMREERRPITVVFADLVGSTALSEVLDSAEVKLIVGDAVARMVGEIERLGGFTKDLAGDGVLAFFGAPIASEDDAERAVLAGLAIVEALDAYGREVEQGWDVHGFGVRVGVTTGPVVVGQLGAGERVEYAAFGETVNVAARLQSAAAPGSVLADAETWRLVEPLFDWQDPTDLKLKGVTGPVRTYQPMRARPWAGKPRGLAGADTPMVGRTQELARLHRAIGAVLEGTGGVVFVIGEAGIGKSRLVTEARTDFSGLWLEGRCVSYGETLPYWPFRDLIRDWLGVADDDPDLRVRVRLRRMVEELFGARVMEVYPYLCSMLGLTPEPEAAARLADLAPEALQYRSFEVVEELLLELAADQSLIVQLEDLHWADTTSVELCERLLALGERAAILFVITQRDDRDHPCWRLREQAAREVPHLLADLALEPLSGDAERELLREIIGDATLPEHLENRLLETAEGNPFFLEEQVRSLIDHGALVAAEKGYHFDHEVEIEIPPTVERVVLARIDRLPPASRDVLTSASALGRTLGRPLLDAVMADSAGVDAALHDLQRLDLLRVTRRWPQAEYRFKHALIQDAAYRTLLPDQRRALHQKAAVWLEQRYAGGEDEVLGLLARHWLEAGADDKAITYLTQAGDQARREWSLDAAIGHYRRLLPLLERRDARQEMALALFKLALALHQALRFREANETYAQAFELWTPPAPVELDHDLIRVGVLSLPDDADPYRSHRIGNIQLYMALFDRLTEAWPDRVIVPSVAERWEISDDGLRYVLYLRTDVLWSDGTPLTAHDVEYGVKRVLNREQPGPSAAIYFVLEHARDYLFGDHHDLSSVGVRALDEYTVEFRLETPAPYFMYVLNRPDCAPQPRHAIAELGEDWIQPDGQVLSGAFRRLEHTSERILLERRTDGAMPRVGNSRQVELRQMSPADAVEAYMHHELDVFNMQFSYQHALIESAPDEMSLDPPAWLTYLSLRHDHPALANVHFRRALALGIDRGSLTSVAAPHATVATGGMVPPPLQGHTPDIAPPFDPDAAREELRRSGVDEGVEVVAFDWSEEAGIIATITAQWEDVLGLRFPVRSISMDDWNEERFPSTIVEDGWFPGYPDPEYYLRLLLHSDAADNHGHYRSEHFDGLIAQARAEPDGRTRLELYHQADRFAVAEDVAAIPLVYERNVIMVKPWVRGWWEYGKSWSSFGDLTVDEGAGPP